MSLLIALGAKSVSSRPLLDNRGTEQDTPYFAEDGITRLVSVQISGSVPLTATAICPLREWMAFVTIQYFDMLMTVDDSSDEDEDTKTTGCRKRLARHSTVAELRLQISPLALPYSSEYPTTIHRLTLPRASVFPTAQGYLDENHAEQISEQLPVQASLVFSSDRRRLACLVPYFREPKSALVGFDLRRLPKPVHPHPRPKVPSYIPTLANEPRARLPVAQDEPQWLALPPGGTTLDIQHTAHYWLHNITAICNASLRSEGKGPSVLLAGCRDGSILGVSFQPLLLVGRLYHPAVVVQTHCITFLSHITITPRHSSKEGSQETEEAISGRLVAIQESGSAILFQTRMVVSSLVDTETNSLDASKHPFHLEDSASNLYAPNGHVDLDATEFSTTSFGPGEVLHGESFNVVKVGRRQSLPASSKLAEEMQPLLYESPNKTPTNHNSSHVVGNTGLLMFLEPLSDYSGQFCCGEWISGTLLALLRTPLPQLPFEKKPPTGDDNARYRVAQVVGVLPGRSPEVLTELFLSSDDLQEHTHTTFTLDENDLSEDENLFPTGILSDTLQGSGYGALEATVGIQHDPHTGCLAISSARREEPHTPKNEGKSSTHNPQTRAFLCIWNWRNNVAGFTAVAQTNSSQRPISRLFYAREAQTNVRKLVHVSSSGSIGAYVRLRKDLYPVGMLSPSKDVRVNRGADLHPASPLLLTSTSVMFASVSHPSSSTTEVEWQECTIPNIYRLECGSPLIATISSSGQSIAVASSRGLCVLECTPRAKKILVGKDREYISGQMQDPAADGESAMITRGQMLPPKWRLFGNETEEKAFRVLTMAWWKGNNNFKRIHSTDDLLVAVIQIQRQEDGNPDPPGTCYLACWSVRRLDKAHQRLRPLDDNLRSSHGQWGFHLPVDFKPKSLTVLDQPIRSSTESTREEQQRDRKAMVLLTSVADPKGAVDFLVFQFQTIPSVGRSQTSESYQEHNPFSVLSRQGARGKVGCPIQGSSIASIFLASASFQFDLRQHRVSPAMPNSPKSMPGEAVNEIIGALGVLRTPGCGLEAVAISSSGISRTATILSSIAKESVLDVTSEMRSSEISSYWLSDTIPGQRPVSTELGGGCIIDFFVWTFQATDGKVYSWFAPCLESLESPRGPSPASAFSSRVMLGLVCSIGSSTTWLRPSPSKTGRDFVIGCMPQSTHGCVLTTAQASRKLHRTIAGDFDHSLFAPDFLEHEFLYPRDFELSPPAFLTSIAALLRCEAFLVMSRDSSTEERLRSQNPGRCPVNIGGDDVNWALLAINVGAHTQMRSKLYQDAAFMACRLILLRTTEQLTDDLRKQKETGSDSISLLSSTVLLEVLAVIKSCSFGRLQFASIVLEVGRQLEPSCFPNLFPLPTSKSRNRTSDSAGNWNLDDLRTVNDVFRACLEDGSLLCAVSTLPIIPGSSLSRGNSMLLLEHCLAAYDQNSNIDADLFFDFSTEERSMLRDIFRFGAKLEDSGKPDYRDDEASIVSLSDSSQGSSKEEAEYDSRRKGYSLACGMLNLSWFRAKPIPSHQNLGPTPTKKEKSFDKEKGPKAQPVVKGLIVPENSGIAVAESVTRLLVKLAMPDNEGLGPAYAWRRSSALAMLLLGQEESLLPKASADECTNMAKASVNLKFKDGVAKLDVEERLTGLLTRCFVSCSSEIGTVAAGKLLDLVLVILMRRSSLLDDKLQALLIVGVTAAFVAERVVDILDVDDRSISFCRCFWAAKEKAESLYSC